MHNITITFSVTYLLLQTMIKYFLRYSKITGKIGTKNAFFDYIKTYHIINHKIQRKKKMLLNVGKFVLNKACIVHI